MMRISTAMILATLAIAPASVAAQTTPAAPGRTPTPAPAQAPAAATPTVGATVYDQQGVTIGTIEAITPQAIVIDTGTVKAPVPPASIGSGAKGLAMAMTKAELEAAVQAAQAQQAAALKASLVAGAQVRGADGTTVLGTIKASDATMVTLTTPKGDVKLPITAFGAGPNGIVAGVTAQQLDAALASAAPAASPTPAAPATPPSN